MRNLFIALVLVLGFTASAQAQVVVDATAAASVHNTGATSISVTFTIGAGCTPNCVLVAPITTSHDPCRTITSANWDQDGTPQAMTVLESEVNGPTGCSYIIGLVDPTTGNRRMQVNFSGDTVEAFAYALSLDGASGFSNPNSSTGTGTSMTLSVTTSGDDMTIASYAGPQVISVVGPTELYRDNDGITTSGAASRGTGSHTGTLDGSVAWSMSGINVVAFEESEPGTKRRLGTLGVGR